MSFLKMKVICGENGYGSHIMINPTLVASVVEYPGQATGSMPHVSVIAYQHGFHYRVPYSQEQIVKCVREARYSNNNNGFVDADDILAKK